MATPRSLGAKLVPQPDSRTWTCALNAFAVASGVGYRALQATIGHDGAEVINREVNTCDRYRGFTDGELIQALWRLGYPVVTILCEGMNAAAKLKWREAAFPHNYVLYFERQTGGLHAVACQGKQCVDISGKIESVEDIDVEKIIAIYYIVKGTECQNAGHTA